MYPDITPVILSIDNYTYHNAGQCYPLLNAFGLTMDDFIHCCANTAIKVIQTNQKNNVNLDEIEAEFYTTLDNDYIGNLHSKPFVEEYEQLVFTGVEITVGIISQIQRIEYTYPNINVNELHGVKREDITYHAFKHS